MRHFRSGSFASTLVERQTGELSPNHTARQAPVIARREILPGQDAPGGTGRVLSDKTAPFSGPPARLGAR